MLRRSPIRLAQLRSRRIGFMRNSAGGSASYDSEDIKPKLSQADPSIVPDRTFARMGLSPVPPRSGGVGVVDLLARHFMPRTTGMSNSRIFLRKVLRLRPSR